MTAAEDRLGEIEGRAAAATEGPWYWEPETDESFPQNDESLRSSGFQDGGYDATVLSGWGYDASGTSASDEDRAFIAHARTDVPLMAAALRAVLALHSPEPYALPEYPPDWCVPIAVCRICVTEDGLGAVAAPCPTVTAITAALTPAEVAL